MYGGGLPFSQKLFTCYVRFKLFAGMLRRGPGGIRGTLGALRGDPGGPKGDPGGLKGDPGGLRGLVPGGPRGRSLEAYFQVVRS